MNLKQQVREAEMKLRRCESKAKTHEEQERCLRQYKIDVLKIKEEKLQAQPMFKDTDKILVHRDGVDYQAELAPLLGGGGAGLDDIINAPVVKEVKYQLWEYFQGSYQSMGLTSGDGESGSTWKAANPKIDYYNNYGQSSLDGYIEYKTSASLDRPRASNCMAVIDDLVATAYSPDQSEVWSGDSATEEKVEIYVDQGFFHANALSKTEGIMGNPKSVVYLLELKFTNVHGDPETLWVDVHNYNYIAMRREDIDLSEMEALDAEIKAKSAKN